MRDRDWCAKVKNKLYVDDKRGAKESDLVEGDQVLVKQARTNGVPWFHLRKSTHEEIPEFRHVRENQIV